MEEREPLRARQRIWVFCAAVSVAIAVSALLTMFPVWSAHRENQQVRQDDLARQRVTLLRTTLADWQVYIEPHLATFSATAAVIDPVDLAKGSHLGQAITAGGRDAVDALNAVGLRADAHAVESANAAFLKSITGLAPLGAGASAAKVSALVDAERAAYAKVWSETANAADKVVTLGTVDLHEAAAHLDHARKTVLTVDALAVTVAVSAALVLGRRARRREIAARANTRRRVLETMLQHALEMSKTESGVYDIVREALRSSVPGLQAEMLVADSNRAHFHQAVSTGSATDAEPRAGCGVVSPLDCPATRRGHTLVFPSSRALDACPHLKNRTTGECSAVCIAISLSGKTTGVLHATGVDDQRATESEVRDLEITAHLASERIAMLRAFEKSEAQARSDPLTGLWNRRSLENRVHDLHRDGIDYALAYGDLDFFKQLNDTHGHEAGDQALRLFSRVTREAIRPNDIAARYGGEEFVVVLPDCSIETAASVLERLRERLALSLTTGRVPPFTVSFGLASSADADTFDGVVATADQALLTAKTAGRDRVVIAPHPDALRRA